MDVSLNAICIFVTGCMKATSLGKLYQSAVSHSLNLRKKTYEFSENFKKTFNNRLFEQHPQRLKFRPTNDKVDWRMIQDMELFLKFVNGPAHCNLNDLW